MHATLIFYFQLTQYPRTLKNSLDVLNWIYSGIGVGRSCKDICFRNLMAIYYNFNYEWKTSFQAAIKFHLPDGWTELYIQVVNKGLNLLRLLRKTSRHFVKFSFCCVLKYELKDIKISNYKCFGSSSLQRKKRDFHFARG